MRVGSGDNLGEISQDLYTLYTFFCAQISLAVSVQVFLQFSDK